MDKLLLTLKIVITLVVIILFVQNIGVVEANFLTWSVSLPLALLLLLVYVLGMISGKSLIALWRRLRRQSPQERR
ncbi:MULTISPECIES: lipopolysaccharide assembly protein LapA domain-containing protein [Halomonadaceae]|uniref:lipopolysaccharide assembly protein LapA domain-containing protein n=1 Tax=Halomonadaceae TaxID=28256 RepID=UPI0015976B17|nr:MULTISPECIES: lipopolysaccharide assembly protein LapA domain-containing protein [Halomonas]QJQ94220.1 DUF1049 domain-containing protein [Halomonas sp. PA5]